MSRKATAAPSSAFLYSVSSETLTTKVRLLTTMMGGGPALRSLDPLAWLRSASLKGALRFWWRAAYGHSFSSIEEMRTAEGALFGATTNDRFGEGQRQSRVQVVVRCGPPSAKSFDLKPENPRTYALFPSLSQRGAHGGPPQAAAPVSTDHPEAAITLRWNGQGLSAHESADGWRQVRHALALYVVFGGAGGRTRRGAGAIGFDEPAFWVKEAGFDDLRALLTVPASRGRWPMFSLAEVEGCFRLKSGQDTADSLWADLLTHWKEIRRSLKFHVRAVGDLRPYVGGASPRYASPIVHAVGRDPWTGEAAARVLVCRSRHPGGAGGGAETAVHAVVKSYASHHSYVQEFSR